LALSVQFQPYSIDLLTYLAILTIDPLNKPDSHLNKPSYPPPP
jgi:hypothetical protein